MREKYESLSVTVLRDLAKARGIKHLSGLKKSELIEVMLSEDAKNEKEQQVQNETAEKKEEPAAEEKKDEAAADDSMKNLDSGVTVNGILEVMPDERSDPRRAYYRKGLLSGTGYFCPVGGCKPSAQGDRHGVPEAESFPDEHL